MNVVCPRVSPSVAPGATDVPGDSPIQSRPSPFIATVIHKDKSPAGITISAICSHYRCSHGSIEEVGSAGKHNVLLALRQTNTTRNEGELLLTI